MSNRDNPREKMSKDFRRYPQSFHFLGNASGICFALQPLCAWLGGGVAARAPMLAFESRGSVVSLQVRAG